MRLFLLKSFASFPRFFAFFSVWAVSAGWDILLPDEFNKSGNRTPAPADRGYEKESK